MKSNKKAIALFFIIAMVNLTPASAMSLGDINNHMTNSLDSYNHMNWWDKIWHIGDVIASLCQVANELSAVINDFNNQAINAQNEASNLKNKLEYLQSLINDIKAQNDADAKYKNAGIAETKKDIHSNSNNSNETNHENITNQSTNQTTISNNSSNDNDENNSLANKTSIINNSTNIVANSSINNSVNNSNSSTVLINNNNHKKSSNSVSKNNTTTNESENNSTNITVSDYAQKDGENFVEAYFNSKNIKYSKLLYSISQLKNGMIVQILKGDVFKYWVFNGITTENGVTYINLITGNGEIYKDDIESFKEKFTGLTYEISNESSEENSVHSVKKIQELQIKSLDSLQNKISQQSTWASVSNYILIVGGAITALGFVLSAACGLFTFIYTIALAAGATIVLGIPCATIATISTWAAVITGIGAVILLVIGIPLTVGGGIALGVLNSINDNDKAEYEKLKNDYNSDEV